MIEPREDSQAVIGRRGGFTLVELMVVAAIITVLLTVCIPAIKGLMQSTSLSSADNMLRAALFSARTYAIRYQVVSGLRCQEDGHMVQVYARNCGVTYTADSYAAPPVYDMKAIEGVQPDRMADPWRVTVRDVGDCDRPNNSSGGMMYSWVGNTTSGYPAAPEWLGEDQRWFVFPVVLFSPKGRVILAECKFSGNPNDPWYPTLDGAFGKACDRDPESGALEPNKNPIPSHPYVRYTNQVALVGWRGGNYKGGGSHTIPVEAPTISSALRIFNYFEWKDMSDKKQAMLQIVSSSSDCILDVNTGLIVRSRQYQKTSSN